MSTNEFDTGGTRMPNPTDFGGADLPAGFPDTDTIARLANEYFSSVPGAKEVGETVLAGTQTPTGAVFPTEAELTAIPASLGVGNFPQASAVNPTNLTSLPGIPGGLGAGDFSSIPTFGFLEEARAFGFPSPEPLRSVSNFQPAIKIPTETELRDFPGMLPHTELPATPEMLSSFATPQIPGTVAHTGGKPVSDSAGFLNESRKLVAIDTIPVLEPFSGDAAGALSNLNGNPGIFDVEAVRRDFPILQERVNGRPLIWLDNAATTQKPLSVIDRLDYFYKHENSNIHRAAHELAARASDAYEAAREKTRRFLNASDVKEILFVRGATEGINLVAQSWGKRHLQKGDEVVITWLEHHANIVPWQMICSEKGARLRIAPVDDHGQILLDEYEKLLNPRTKMVAFPQVSNALGTVTPVQEMVAMAHRYGAKVLVDGAQAVSHMRVDVQAYDCDFYVFSGHKLFAPTGIGVVYGKSEVLDTMPPYQGGGNMISDVTFERTIYQPPPGRFEAGTGNIADAVGLGAALDYLDRIGMNNIARHEHELLLYATEAMQAIPGLRMIGTAQEKAGVLSFVLDGFRNEDVGAALNREGIAVRAGHHCAQPILRRFGLESTVRPSLALYNTCEDIDALIAALWNIKNGRGPAFL